MIAKITVDPRILAASLRYAIERKTGMIDIVVEELEYNAATLPIWLLEAIVSDMEFHLRIHMINHEYAQKAIQICGDNLEKLKK